MTSGSISRKFGGPISVFDIVNLLSNMLKVRGKRLEAKDGPNLQP
jgi:hypothetical protein